jgi:secretion/DNA translocation related TadE-like protein
MAGLVVLVALLLAGLGAVAVTRHRAASAADLAALAAADVALQGPEVACAAAARAAQRGATALTACRLDGDIVEVVVVLRPGGVLGRLGEARAVARAGPTVTPEGTNRPPRASRCRRTADLPTLLPGTGCADQTFPAGRTPA